MVELKIEKASLVSLPAPTLKVWVLKLK